MLKTFSGSYPILALFNRTTFSQTQTCATVPLNMQVPRRRCLARRYISS
jgi:hypothetical protein